MRIGLWDSGQALADHQELLGRVSPGDQAIAKDHATHVGGTLIAAGIRPEARGMAYEAELLSYDWTNDATEMANEAAQGLLVSNHSYSEIAGWYYGDVEGTGDAWYWTGDPDISVEEDYYFGWYDLEATQYDRVAHDSPYYLPVVSAGNDREDRGPAEGTYRALNASDEWQTYQIIERPIPEDGSAGGYDTIAGAGVAKNVLTVGSIDVLTSDEVKDISSYSSFGPADDGRVKPDIMGYGEHLFSSTALSPTSYGYSSGTSMSTCNVSGSLPLLQQYYHQLTGSYMLASTLKGLVLHTARDLSTEGPDYQSGWGLLDTEAAAWHIGASVENPTAIYEGSLDNGSTFERVIETDGTSPLKVTLSWTDAPSTRLPLQGPGSLDDPHPHLVNDLDVRLKNDLTGEIHLPFTLHPDHPSDPAVAGDNRVDPIEQIYVPLAANTTYTITVSHKGELSGASVQSFALHISGAVGEVPPIAIVHLEAEVTVDFVALQWQTAYERNDGVLSIERARVHYTPGGQREVGIFTPIDTLSLAGPSSSIQQYRYEDLLVPAGRYVYRLFYIDRDHQFVVEEIQVNVPAPDDYAVISNYPNPFSDLTRLIVDVPRTKHVNVAVFNTLGRRVYLLQDSILEAGRLSILINSTDWPAGLYFARIQTGKETISHPLVVVR